VFLNSGKGQAKNWIKAIVLALLAYVLFFIPNSTDAADLIGYLLLTKQITANTIFFVELVQIGAILSALVVFLSAIWE
jgi:undecaprenyl pyrophosphate phosphatase UppP